MAVFLIVVYLIVAFGVAPLTGNPESANWIYFGWLSWLIVVYAFFGILVTFALFLYVYKGE